MTNREITADGLYDFVSDRGGGVSFVEVMRWGGKEAEGDWAMSLIPNLYIWAGMSEKLIDIINELRKSKRLLIEPSSRLVYMIDGGLLSWPTPKRIPKQGFKKEHWSPVVFYTDLQHRQLRIGKKDSKGRKILP